MRASSRGPASAGSRARFGERAALVRPAPYRALRVRRSRRAPRADHGRCAPAGARRGRRPRGAGRAPPRPPGCGRAARGCAEPASVAAPGLVPAGGDGPAPLRRAPGSRSVPARFGGPGGERPLPSAPLVPLAARVRSVARAALRPRKPWRWWRGRRLASTERGAWSSLPPTRGALEARCGAQARPGAWRAGAARHVPFAPPPDRRAPQGAPRSHGDVAGGGAGRESEA